MRAKIIYWTLATAIAMPCDFSLAAADEIPTTVTQAVEILKTKWLKPEDLDRLLRMPKEQAVSELHLPFGTAVRNSWNLWKGNSKLLASCGVDHPEDCSGVIFGKLWDDLRAHADPKLLAGLDCQFQLTGLVQIKMDGFYKMQLGDVLKSIQNQIDEQAPAALFHLPKGCDSKLILKPIGSPDLKCWTRAEFSKEGQPAVLLDRLLGWISWRNGFSYRHDPPFLELPFHKSCSWPEMPKHFRPEGLH